MFYAEEYDNLAKEYENFTMSTYNITNTFVSFQTVENLYLRWCAAIFKKRFRMMFLICTAISVVCNTNN